jgi:hypothetical protein
MEFEGRVFMCPGCGRVASIADGYNQRPLCVHMDEPGGGPEVIDGNDTDGEGRPIEMVPHEPSRVPGPHSWNEMVPFPSDEAVQRALRAFGVLPDWSILTENKQMRRALEAAVRHDPKAKTEAASDG